MYIYLYVSLSKNKFQTFLQFSFFALKYDTSVSAICPILVDSVANQYISFSSQTSIPYFSGLYCIFHFYLLRYIHSQLSIFTAMSILVSGLQ